MMTRLLAATTGVVLGLVCRADVSVYLTRGGVETLYATYVSGQAISDLPDMSDTVGAPVTAVRIFGAPADTVGPITLSGTRTTQLDLLVAASSVLQTPAQPDPQLVAGAGSWEGLSAPASLVGTVRLAASVSGAITGPVDCGQVFTLRARRINAPLVAHAGDSQAGGAAIRLIAVGNVDSQQGGGGEAQGGVTEAGLFGSVSAASGTIGTLTVTGRISIAPPGGIEARNGINALRCLDASGAPTGPIDAAIDADPGHYTGFDQRIGALNLLECGDLSGTVNARNLNDGLSQSPAPVTIAAGSVSAAITVSGDMWGTIEAASVSGPITIAGNQYASIHAAGDIASVDVGGSITWVSTSCTLPNILSDAGSIGSINVGGGIDTSDTAGCQPDLSIIYAPQGIGSLHCAGHFGAHILGPSGPISIGSLVVGGDWLAGNVQCTQASVFEVHGSVFEQGPTFASVPATTTVKVGGHMDGTMVVSGAAGLHGQVILNANGGAGPVIAGQVILHTANGSYGINGPEYPVADAEFGGGAVGVAPFHFKPSESSPLSLCQTPPCVYIPDPPLPDNYMALVGRGTLDPSGPGIVVTAYGPIKRGAGQVVHCFMGNQWGGIIPGSDVGSFLEATFSGRTLALRLRAGHEDDLPPGRYIIRHYASEGGILCDGLFAAADIPAGELIYNFYYLKQGTPDIAGCADFNGDGDNATDADIEDFFRVLAGGTCLNDPPHCGSADFNCDGDSATDADIQAFFAAIAGRCPAGCY